MYKGVIFDFNGTLFFDNPKHILAWSKISEEIRGCGISEEELHKYINGVPNHKVVEYLFGGKCTLEQMEKYSSLKEMYYRQFCEEDKDSFHLVDGATDYFSYLKEMNIPFTIASASIKENIDFFVESFHLEQWMDPDTIIYDDGSYENKVEMFKTAAQVIGVDIQDCRIIEDSKSGIQSGYKAGCKNIIVVDSAHKREEYIQLPGVTGVIETFKNVTSI